MGTASFYFSTTAKKVKAPPVRCAGMVSASSCGRFRIPIAAPTDPAEIAGLSQPALSLMSDDPGADVRCRLTFRERTPTKSCWTALAQRRVSTALPSGGGGCGPDG